MNRKRIGIDLRPALELAPVMISTPPSNSFTWTVFPLSRDRGSATRSRSAGVDSIIGASRCLLTRFAVSTVGCTISIGPGARWITKPLGRMGRRQAIHDLAQIGRASGAPLSRLSGGGVAEETERIGPRADGKTGLGRQAIAEG